MLQTPEYFIDVLICTYKRPSMLVETLEGVRRAASGIDSIRIIVVDNDEFESAREPAHQWQASSGIQLIYLSQPRQNISLTRNKALEHASAAWVVMIDDDEVPDMHWLHNLVATAKEHSADAVFGPVISVFEPNAPKWATHGALFQRKRFPTGTPLPQKEARTGNVLLRGALLAEERIRFDPELGLSGGEDSEFFARLGKAGRKLVWADEACVYEMTPPSRTRLAWVLKRGFRIGSVDGYQNLRTGDRRRTIVGAAKHFIFIVQGTAQTIIWAPFSSANCVNGMRRATMGAGYFYGLLGRPYSEYQTAST